MDYTYLDYFNYYLKEYLNELVNTFPETREPILSNYRPLLEASNNKNDIYAKCYYTKINNFLTQIATKDETMFETSGKIFIEGVDLYSIWNHNDATAENRTAIWKYLQILMILGRKIMPNHKEIVDILNNNSNFKDWYTAGIYNKNQIGIRQKRPSTQFHTYISNSEAEFVLKFNKNAGIADIPSLTS